MSVSHFIARRLSLNSSSGRLSPAVSVGIAAVALAVLVMTCALAIVSGFKREITSKITGFNSNMTLTAALPATSSELEAEDPMSMILTLTPTLEKILDNEPYISGYALQASAPAIFKTQDDFRGVYLKSLSGSDNERFIREALTEGYIPDFSIDSTANKIVIPSRIADALSLKPGDKIDTYFITDRIIVRPLSIAGIYDSHFNSYDQTYSFASLALIQEIGALKPNQGTSISISVDDFGNVQQNTIELSQKLADAYNSELIYRQYNVSNAIQAGAGYFHWLSMLDTNVIVILTLMTIVALVTIISGMLILMVDKIRIIALLSALGAGRKLIGKIFMRLAIRIAVIGLLIGDFLSIGLLYFQDTTHFIPLDPENYYIDFVPVEISFSQFLILNIAVLAIIWLALILPAGFAGKVAPARTLASE